MTSAAMPSDGGAVLQSACDEQRIELRGFAGVTVIDAGDVVPGDGDHYRVFTPYWRAWSEHPRRAPLRAPRQLALPRGIPSGRLPSLRSLISGRPSRELVRGGENAARSRLDAWLRAGLADYEETRDDLAAAATSRLSADLHFGCLSPLSRCWPGCAGRPGGAGFVRQLCWRDFHHQVLAARPDLRATADYRPRGDRWRRRERYARGLEAGPHRLSDRRRGDAPARPRGLHAQPGAPDRRLVPDQGRSASTGAAARATS